MIVVVDTNVWISALVFSRPGSVPRRVLDRVVREDTLAISAELRHEVYSILTGKCRWRPRRAANRLGEFQTGALVVTLRHNVHICRDPKDDMFLECAELANADVLVTGDKDLLSLGSYGATRILTPLEYVELPR